MFTSRRLIFGFIAVFSLYSPATALAQDPPLGLEDAKQMKKLLEEAEEEYRKFFEKPTTAPEYWSAIQFEVELGKFDLAALFLKQLLALEPKDKVDRQLVTIEEAKGLSQFTRLRAIKKWTDYEPFNKEAKKNVENLIDRLTTALKKHLSDAARIKKFINNLDAETREERAYAFFQLSRSGPYAAAYLVDALRDNRGKALHDKIVDAMLRLPKNVVPGFLEIFAAKNEADAEQVNPRLTLLDIVYRRNDERVVPYLWHMSKAKMYPPIVRDKVKTMLAFFLKTKEENLPPAQVELVEMAEQYFRHEVRFTDPDHILHWPWSGERLAIEPLVWNTRRAEFEYGSRHALQALDLDPDYRRAHTVYLNFVLDRTLQPTLKEETYKKTPDEVKQMLLQVDTELLLSILDQAMAKNRVTVALPIIESLGLRGAVRAARINFSGRPIGLAKALYVPNRRIQHTTAAAMLNLPTSDDPVESARVVEILRRFVAMQLQPKALIVFPPKDQAAMIRGWVRAAGWEPVIAYDTGEAVKALHASADFDVIFVHSSANRRELPYSLAQFRQDRNHGHLPLLIITPKDLEEEMERFSAKYPYTWTVPEVYVKDAKQLTPIVNDAITKSVGLPLTKDERAQFQQESLDFLWKMARGVLPGYNVRPAQDAVIDAVASEKLAVQALEILGRLPGLKPQQKLAEVVLDPTQKKVHVTALKELNRHVQKYSLLLSNRDIDRLENASAQVKDATLRNEFAILVARINEDGR